MEQSPLTELTKIKYNSFGFPFVFLSYDFETKKWSCTLRNPKDFQNPNTESDTPNEAVKKLLEFLKQ